MSLLFLISRGPASHSQPPFAKSHKAGRTERTSPVLIPVSMWKTHPAWMRSGESLVRNCLRPQRIRHTEDGATHNAPGAPS
eukprot:5128746-Amphidinium_carterae.1